jgi:hypothetical protein
MPRPTTSLLTVALAVAWYCVHCAVAQMTTAATLLSRLEQDGLLTREVAQKARTAHADLFVIESASSSIGSAAATRTPRWRSFLSLANFVKAAAVISLIVAFSGIVINVAKGVWWLLVQVPIEVYQVAFLVPSVAGLVPSRLMAPHHTFFIALFCSASSIITILWIIVSHKILKQSFEHLLERLEKRNQLHYIIGTAGTCFFGALALLHSSRIFGVFTAVSLSALTSFGVAYEPRVLTLYFRQDMLAPVVLGHLAVVSPFAVLRITGTLPAAMQLFEAGMDYYCTIALGVGFLVGASPWYMLYMDGYRPPDFEQPWPWRPASARSLKYLLLFLAVLTAATVAFFFTDLKTPGSILFAHGVLLAMEWVGFWAARWGFVFFTLVAGTSLYGAGMLLDHFGHLLKPPRLTCC